MMMRRIRKRLSGELRSTIPCEADNRCCCQILNPINPVVKIFCATTNGYIVWKMPEGRVLTGNTPEICGRVVYTTMTRPSASRKMYISKLDGKFQCLSLTYESDQHQDRQHNYPKTFIPNDITSIYLASDISSSISKRTLCVLQARRPAMSL